MFKRIQRVHFVGIGGIGMSGIAEVLLNLGYQVSGSDLKTTEITERLRTHGATIFTEHRADNVRGAHVIVVSSAVRPGNPEIREAELRKIPVIPRAEMLAELMRLKYSIAVAGTHGKTTTTSMIASVLDRAGLDPTIVVGGLLNTLGSNARLGKGDYIVIEADESDRSFLMLSPTIAVVTNIEADHLDHYQDLADIQSAFTAFVNRVPFYGAVVLCLDEPGVQTILPGVKRRVVTYGTAPHADVCVVESTPDGLGSKFTVRFDGNRLQPMRLNVPGVHNVLNATAAFAAARDMGIPVETIAAGLESFSGVERRFEVKTTNGITVIDDYAHHPTEVRATLAAARAAGFGHLIVVFQPHRYSRTQHLFEDFARAFNQADTVLMLDIYPAGEPPLPGIDTPALIERMNSYGHRNAMHMATFEAIEAYVGKHVKKGDAVIVMGAGSVTRLADSLSARFSKTA